MTTHCRIGIVNLDTSVDSIYCHMDGYPSHNGRILAENYASELQIHKLLELGGLLTLGKDIGVAHPNYVDVINNGGEYKEWKRLYGDMCLAFGRDLNGDMPLVHSDDVTDFRKLQESYNYLFVAGVWYMCEYNNHNWRQLSRILVEEFTKQA